MVGGGRPHPVMVGGGTPGTPHVQTWLGYPPPPPSRPGWVTHHPPSRPGWGTHPPPSRPGWGTPTPVEVWTDKQTENSTFPHPSDAGGNYPEGHASIVLESSKRQRPNTTTIQSSRKLTLHFPWISRPLTLPIIVILNNLGKSNNLIRISIVRMSTLVGVNSFTYLVAQQSPRCYPSVRARLRHLHPQRPRPP